MTDPVILVVEDETLVRLVANECLTEAGFRVLEARDGQEALTILSAQPNVQALVSDIRMPNLDGVSLAKLVRERWPEIGIVLTSAELRPVGTPADIAFLPKPYREAKLIQAVRAAIGHPVRPAGVPLALHSMPNFAAGQQHGAGGLAQPVAEPEK